MIILTVVLCVIIAALCYVIFNLLTKLEQYEKSIEEFYTSLSYVLHVMRTLDEKRMFETDDEVGEVFSQLVDIISTLRPILYGTEQNDQEEN
jgi:hypothetical protein